ncbi:MAG TPA: MerR family transcriptional regulator [Candidatus Binataceae bacterium]|nr:MerR family transcriptional regulator [Candidatus Binataceae bacterium]
MKLYSLNELVTASALSVDTIRYYQNLGLLAGPRRRGRSAVYNESHLKRLRRIRSMSERGLPLKLVKSLLTRPKKDAIDRALIAAVEETASEACYTSAEVAAMLGIPKGLLAMVENSELREAIPGGGGLKVFSQADLDAARGIMRLLEFGLPVTALLETAVRHHRAITRTADRAIDLFNAYIRASDGQNADPEAVADAFRQMLPIVVSLVAQHFQRVLVGRALARIRQSGDQETLRVAERTAEQVRLRMAVR